jgi:N-acetyl-anhydromuramoyl-L-alanine amidase
MAGDFLPGTRIVPSPNRDARPEGVAPEIIVVHAISLPQGIYGGPDIERFFTNALDPAGHPFYREIHDLRVSAHFLVRRDGEIVQFVPVSQRAWHAGRSWCEGRDRVNDFSIGIELEGCDDEPFAPPQYDALVRLTRELMQRYPGIRKDRIYAHSDVAPGRKTDPGPFFDWKRYLAQLA